MRTSAPDIGDLASRLAAVDVYRRRVRTAMAIRLALGATICLVSVAAMIVLPIAMVVVVSPFLTDLLRARFWLILVVVLASGVAAIVAGVVAARTLYRRFRPAVGAEYEARFEQDVVTRLIATALPSARLTVGQGIPRATFERSALFSPAVQYDTRFQIAGRTDGTAWMAGDVDAWEDVVRGGDSSRVRWLVGMFAWFDVACPVHTPVLVSDPLYMSPPGYGHVRRSDLVSGRMDDAVFDERFVSCVSQDERAMPALSAGMRGVLLELRDRIDTPLVFCLTPIGVALGVPIENRRLLAPRTLVQNDVAELTKEAGWLALMPHVAAALARAARS
jgi:hypothetical protein